MNVEFTMLKRQFELYGKEYEEAILKTARSGWYILGKEVSHFEELFASYLGVKHCIGLNSGQDALILAVRALGLKQGDEVIVQANTYIATVLGITENNVTPVFVDSDAYYGLDAEKIEAAVTNRTKAILPVHLYGQSCNMDKIKEISDKYNLFMIEDCAQSHGVYYNGQKCGTFGDIGCFSFYPTKPLGAFGDAGAIVTNDDSVAEKVRMLRNYGSRVKYHNEIEGINSRMDELQAAILQAGLRHLDEGNLIRENIAERYLTGIKNPKIMLPKTRKNSDHIYHIFPVICKERDKLQEFLLSHGIKTQIHYPIPPHLSRCYIRLGYSKGNFPITEGYAEEELSIPIYVGMDGHEVEYVIDTINQFE